MSLVTSIIEQVVNFGISTTIWDRLFGTFQPTHERAPDVFWSTIRSYWMKLTCKPCGLGSTQWRWRPA